MFCMAYVISISNALFLYLGFQCSDKRVNVFKYINAKQQKILIELRFGKVIQLACLIFVFCKLIVRSNISIFIEYNLSVDTFLCDAVHLRSMNSVSHLQLYNHSLKIPANLYTLERKYTPVSFELDLFCTVYYHDGLLQIWTSGILFCSFSIFILICFVLDIFPQTNARIKFNECQHLILM